MFKLQTIEGARLMVGRVSGVLDAWTVEQVVEFMEIEELENANGFHRYCDLSALEGVHLSTNDILRMAERRREFNPNSIPVKSAFFATDPLSFGIARMYEQLLNSPRIEVRVWSDRESAANWLGVRVDSLAV